jgi:hypothetical protein
VQAHLSVTLGGHFDWGIAQSDDMAAEVDDCQLSWRNIAECLASEVADLLERHELDTAFETLDSERRRLSGSTETH